VLNKLFLVTLVTEPAPAPAPAPAPEDWVPPVPGMLKGEEDLYFEWRFSQHPPREAPPAGFDLTFGEFFHRELEKRTKGRLKIKEFYGGQLGKIKEAPFLLGKGVYEMGFTPHGEMFPDLFPLNSIVQMPLFVPDDFDQASLLSQYAWSHPLVLEELAKNNLMYGYVIHFAPSYQIFRKGLEPITKVEDLAGLKHRAKGYTAAFSEALGMIPVNLPGSESYESLQKGMLDTSEEGLSSIKNRKLYEVCDSILNIAVRGGGGTGVPSDVNLDAWNSLPQYIKDIWREIESDARVYTKGLYEALRKESLAVVEDNGMEFFTLPPEEEAKYLAAGVVAWEKLVENIEKRPGGEKIREYIKDCIAFRDKITGKPWTVYKP
jgi:TRAP-type C4-dicarboxylate transport system substrate-binding protein